MPAKYITLFQVEVDVFSMSRDTKITTSLQAAIPIWRCENGDGQASRNAKSKRALGKWDNAPGLGCGRTIRVTRSLLTPRPALNVLPGQHTMRPPRIAILLREFRPTAPQPAESVQ
jgi:hypothetical protein